jgi:hypothetical protein
VSFPKIPSGLDSHRAGEGTHSGGAVHSVSMMSGELGWGFYLRDCAGRHWITISYRTEADAKAAREKIEAATADAEIMVH